MKRRHLEDEVSTVETWPGFTTAKATDGGAEGVVNEGVLRDDDGNFMVAIQDRLRFELFKSLALQLVEAVKGPKDAASDPVDSDLMALDNVSSGRLSPLGA